METYCKTLMIASQLKQPLPEIPASKIDELLAIKKKLGLPDKRLPRERNSRSTKVTSPDGISRCRVAAHKNGKPDSSAHAKVDQWVDEMARILDSYFEERA